MNAWRDVPTLAGRYVTLRPMEERDKAAIVAALGDIAHLFYTFVPTEDSVDAWCDRVMRERDAGRSLPFVVLDAEGRVSGTTRFMRMSAAHQRAEIGGTLYAPRVQRTGLNTEAKRLLLAHAFEKMGCECVQLRTDWLNQQSRTAIERLGAKRDGVLRGHMIMADGHRRDTVVYSILASEWPGVRSNLDLRIARYERESR